jgi:hypothetical protein
MKKTGRVIAILVLFVLVFGCSPQARLTRLVAKHPELKTNDTITVKDTVIIPAVKVDTSKVMKKVDTFYIDRDRVHLEVIRHDDTIKVEGGSRSDTVIKEVPVIVPKFKILPPDPETTAHLFWRRVPWVAAIVFFLVAAFMIIIYKRRS